jgi:cytochrome c-type biogenesis protein CcmH
MRHSLTLAVFLLIGLLVGTAFVSLTGAAKPTFQELEESLTCQCGCGLTVHSCNHLQCDSALPLRAEIREQMALGKGKAQILAHFVSKYGEKILSSPTTTGFNLTAWIMPFALVFLGGVFVLVTLVRWSARRPAVGAAAGQTVRPHEASPYDRILERELKDFDND